MNGWALKVKGRRLKGEDCCRASNFSFTLHPLTFNLSRMDPSHFFVSVGLKAIGLAFLSLVAVKAVAGLRLRGPAPGSRSRGLAWLRGILYAAILAMVVVGAFGVGIETAAGIHGFVCDSAVAHGQPTRAYNNARRAVELRPGTLLYWQQLSRAKFMLLQFDSVLKDEPVLRKLSPDTLDEKTLLRLALSHYFLGHYDQVVLLTEQIIHGNPSFGTPYVLEAMTYVAEKRYAQAERRFRAVLRFAPTDVGAVEGLAHVRYLMGDPGGALQVLDQTSKFEFDPEARKRFEMLKEFYAQ
jgi:tetratricopeptide (TPR) repeat protein